MMLCSLSGRSHTCSSLSTMRQACTYGHDPCERRSCPALAACHSWQHVKTARSAEVRAAIARSPVPSASPRSNVGQGSPQANRSGPDSQPPAQRQSSVSSVSPLSHLGREGSLGSQTRLSHQASVGSPGQAPGLSSQPRHGSQASLGSRVSQQSALSHHAPLGSPGQSLGSHGQSFSSHGQSLGQAQLSPHQLSQLQSQQQHRLLQQQGSLPGPHSLGGQNRSESVDATLLRQHIALGGAGVVQQPRGQSLDPALLGQNARGAFQQASSQQLYMGLLQRGQPPPPVRDYQVHGVSCMLWSAM